MDSLKDRVCDYIASTDHVSFAELVRRFPEFGGGSIALELRDNLVMWGDLTQEAADAMKDLQREGRIVAKPSSLLVYLADGQLMNLPIAKRFRAYKKPHWLPVTFRSISVGG